MDLIAPVGSALTSAANIFEAGKNRDFQERMSNTTHQREVADLKAAHLNPILSAKLGGNPAPMGNVPQISDLGQAYTSAKQTNANKDLLAAQTEKTKQEARVAKVTADNTEYNTLFLRKFPEYDLALQRQKVDLGDVSTSSQSLKALQDQLLSESSSAKAKSRLLNLEIPEAKQTAAMYKRFGGALLPYVPHAQSALKTGLDLSLLLGR